MLALQNDNVSITDLLLQQAELDVNRQDKSQKTALEIALLEKRDLKVAQRLVEKNADMNVADSDGNQKLTFVFLVAALFQVKHYSTRPSLLEISLR